MSKKVNFGTINAEALSMFSDWNVANFKLRSLKADFDAKVAPIDKRIEEIKANRAKAIEEGMTTDEAISKYSINEAQTERLKAESEYQEACKPYKTAMREAQKFVPDTIYYAYAIALKKGDNSATGELKLSDNKTIIVTDSFKKSVNAFLSEIGCYTDSDIALNKFATIMINGTNGFIKSNKGTSYVRLKNMNTYKDLFIRVFLEHVVNTIGVVTRNDDNTLSMTVYENKTTNA